MLKYWKELKKDLFTIKAEGLEDFRAVIGSKTSRAYDLNMRAEIDSAGLEQFLTTNLAGYGHASIGEMSFPTVHHRGMGWVAAWLLEDDPLFIGQEVSTRAVDVRNIGKDVCYDAPKELKDHNDLYWNIFGELEKKNTESKGYKFDKIRWAMPGTARVGVTFMMNARTGIRHLERVESIPFMRSVVENMFLGVKDCSPYVFNSLRKGPRSLHSRWILEHVKNDKFERGLDFSSSVEITPPEGLSKNEFYDNLGVGRPEREYLDPNFKALGLFKIRIYCSVAASRDWHRHRTVMPWKIYLMDKMIAPWYDISGYEQDIKNDFAKRRVITSQEDSMQQLYEMPYGAIVAIEGYASLPDLLYMLELRALAGGANFEYALQAKEGLLQLTKIMGKKFTEHHSLDRVLKILEKRSLE